MNRLIQAGIGMGLTAGAVLFPGEADAATQPQSAETQTAGNCGANGAPFMVTNEISNQMCQAGNTVTELITVDFPVMTHSLELTSETENQQAGDYIGPLALCGLAAVITGCGYAAIRKRVPHGISYEANQIKHMKTSTFNDELEILLKSKLAKREK